MGIQSKKIVLVNQEAGYLFVDVANAFAKEYDEVVLLAGSISWLEEPIDKRIKIIYIKKYDKKSLFKRMYSWAIAFIQLLILIKTRYNRGYDLLVCSNPPLACWLPVFCSNKASVLVYDIYPDGLVAANFISNKHIVYKFWAGLNKRAYKKANKIFTLTTGMAKQLEKYAPEEKIRIVPAWAGMSVDPSNIAEGENLFVNKYGLQGKFIIMYSGNIGKEYDLESLVKLAERFKDNEHILFIIMGTGWKKELLENMIKEKSLDNFMLLPFQPPDLFLHSLKAFHVGVVSLVEAAAKLAIPSKTYNLLAANRPVFCIGNEESDLADFLKENNVGKTIDATKMDEMKTFIEQLYYDKNYYKLLCNNAALVSKKFTKERAQDIVTLLQ